MNEEILKNASQTPPRPRNFPWAWVALFLIVFVCGSLLFLYLSIVEAPQRQMRQALSLLEEGRLEDAAFLYRTVAITEEGSDLGAEAEIRYAFLNSSLENRPMDPVLSQAALLLSSGRRREAVALYRSAQTTASPPQEELDSFNYQDRFSQESLTAPDSAEDFYQLGVLYALYGSGSAEDIAKGYSYFLEAANRFPDAPERASALYFAGVCADRLNRLENAVAVWTRLINEHPYDPHVPEVLFGIGYYNQTAFRNPDAALNWYRLLIRDYPENTYSEWAREQVRLLGGEALLLENQRAVPSIVTPPGPTQ